MEPFIENIWVFLGTAIVISLTGVMTPGPLFAASIAKGYTDKSAGFKIAIGHGLVEFPLMAIIALSLGYVFESTAVRLAIGLVGGALMIFLGLMMLRKYKDALQDGSEYLPYDSITAGALTTSLNPYFLLWWATIGAWLIMNANWYGPIIVVVFAVVHWSCDLGWYMLTSYTVFRTKHLWTPRVHQLVFAACGVIMVAFGIYFVVGPALDLVGSL